MVYNVLFKRIQRLFCSTHILMSFKRFRIERPKAKITFLQTEFIVLFKGLVIQLLQVLVCDFILVDNLIKIWRSFRTRSSFFFWQFLLLQIPFFLTVRNVNLNTLCPIPSSTNITSHRFWHFTHLKTTSVHIIDFCFNLINCLFKLFFYYLIS